jgi:hypothetical protein
VEVQAAEPKVEVESKGISLLFFARTIHMKTKATYSSVDQQVLNPRQLFTLKLPPRSFSSSPSLPPPLEDSRCAAAASCCPTHQLAPINNLNSSTVGWFLRRVGRWLHRFVAPLLSCLRYSFANLDASYLTSNVPICPLIFILIITTVVKCVCLDNRNNNLTVVVS